MSDNSQALDTAATMLTITDLSHDGRGIAHIANKVIFVEGALPGEQVTVNKIKRRSQFDETTLNEIIKASPQRVVPGCAHFGVCGGCSLQHLDNRAQIQFKQQALLANFEKFGKVIPEQIIEPIQAHAWGYRNKARLGVKYVKGKGRVLVGFREKQSRYLADIHQCPVLNPVVGEKLDVISAVIGKLGCYNKIAQIEVAISEQSHALVFRNLVALADTDRALLIKLAQDENYDIYLQPKGPTSVELLYPAQSESGYCLDEYNICLKFLPTDFTQVNPYTNSLIVRQALHWLDPDEKDNILELFCGIGNFTLPIAKFARKVLAVEGEKNLVARAADNAEHNSISNIDYHIANLMEDVSQCSWVRNSHYSKIFLDPPRSGAKEIIALFPKFDAQRIVYVSCNPATLARDAATLVNDQGYRLKKAGVIDMFPHTSHVESVALFEK